MITTNLPHLHFKPNYTEVIVKLADCMRDYHSPCGSPAMSRVSLQFPVCVSVVCLKQSMCVKVGHCVEQTELRVD